MELWEFFPKCLACTSRHVVLILDSLDQLPAEDGGRRLEWLPRNLPDNVFLVLSTLPSQEYECFPRLKVVCMFFGLRFYKQNFVGVHQRRV